MFSVRKILSMVGVALVGILCLSACGSPNPAVTTEHHFMTDSTYRCATGFGQVDLPSGDVVQVDGSRYTLDLTGYLTIKLAKDTSLPAIIVHEFVAPETVVSVNLADGSKARYALPTEPDSVTLCTSTAKTS